MSYAVVWLNGLCPWALAFGYASWRLNLTPYVKPGGDNKLVIRLTIRPVHRAGIRAAEFIAMSGWKNVAVHGTMGNALTTPDVSPATATVHRKWRWTTIRANEWKWFPPSGFRWTPTAKRAGRLRRTLRRSPCKLH